MIARLTAVPSAPIPSIDRGRLECLCDLERKVLWLSAWMIHHANHLRPNRDGLKVGGHQASCASMTTLMTALYFHSLKPQDRVAVKPHAAPVYHAIQYLLGRQSREQLERFRALGGAQAYPSRTKDADGVDFSTGSVGLGAALTLFASLAQDYLRLHELIDQDAALGRMIALIGDAEFDEGNMFEAVLEGCKHDVRNLWWIIDYNRQSLDAVLSDERLFRRFDHLFEVMGWKVITLKYGKRQEAAFARPGGEALREWIDDCPNSLYSALTFKGNGWRERLECDLGRVPGIKALLDDHDEEELHALMTNLGGHDMETVLEAFDGAEGDRPHCFIAYTIKGYRLPFAGHKDNHSDLMNPAQMARFKTAQGIPDGAEWEPFAGMEARADALECFLKGTPRASDARASDARAPAPARIVPVPRPLPIPVARQSSTQEAFGRILSELAKGESALAARIVTASPDVTVSTNLGGWVNRRGLFGRTDRPDLFRQEKVASPQRWAASPSGQHVELGIAEHNLFLLLTALGLSGALYGERLLPIGTLYDPFIQRGLDALNYGCYTDARFMVVA
ncbi:MAG: transketolase, partial [Alphaproteobacteria bacterium]